MKFSSLAVAALASALPALAQDQHNTMSYDTTYDNSKLPLTSVACSDGVNGLISKGYQYLGSLPKFPNVGGVYTVDGFNSPACGSCYEVTWTENGNKIYILAVDSATRGFNVAKEAMDALTGGLAEQLGRIDVTSKQVDASVCKL